MATAIYGQPGCQVCGCETRHVVAATYETYCGPTCEEAGRTFCICGHDLALHLNGKCFKTYPGRLCSCLEVEPR